MKSIKFSDIVTIVKPEYVFLKLRPNNAIRNNGTHKIARTISSLYKNVLQNIKIEEQKLVKVMGKDLFIPTKFSFHTNAKVSYYVYMEKKKVEFYFIIPKQCLSLLKEKMSDSWSNVTIQEVTELPTFQNDATKYQLYYRKEDGLSLAVDRRNNDLLQSNLNVVEVLDDGDSVGILYNFIPSSQHSWKHQHRHTIEKVKSHKPVDRNKMGFSYVLKYGLSVVDGLVSSISEALAGKKVSVAEDNNILASLLEKLNGGKRVNESSMKKGNAPIIPTQVVVFSQSENKLRERNAAIGLAQSFGALHDDNELMYKSLKKDFKITDYSIGAERSKFSDEEAQNFISLAGRDILEKFNFIEKVETHETVIPDDLTEGVMCLGENVYRGTSTKAYLSNDTEYRNLLTLLIAPTRSGKTNLLSNFAVDAIENGESVLILDFIENCEYSDSVAALFSKEKILEVRCDDFDLMQGLGYNEVGHSSDVFTQYDNSKKQTSNVLALVNSVHTDESRLSPKMERYLESASLIVFINGGSIKDVFNVLQNHIRRRDFLRCVPRNQYENLNEYMDSLKELDDYDSKTGELVGTKSNLVVGVIDRLNTLKRNTYMELMLKKDTKSNFDLCEEMQKNQLITIKMPQTMFPTEFEKDTCVLFWLTKIWMAAQIRADKIRDKKKRTKLNIFIDELYQCPNSEKYLTTKLSQMAKFIMKPIISCHNISQLRHMRSEMKSANTSYILISGCDESNYKELKNEMLPFGDEDLRMLPRYHAIHIAKCQQGYAKFITKLPGKVEDRIRKEVSTK